MLTVETLRQNAALASLTDAQLTAIAEMSRNDENTVIGARIGALHGQYDTDILGITGIVKNDGEKSYDYAKRVLSEYKTKAESVTAIQAELTKAKADVTALQAKLEKGAADETLAQQLKDAKAQVAQLQAKLTTKETEYKAAKDKFDTDLKNTHIDYAFKSAASGLKFKDGITEPIQKTLLAAAKAEVLAKGTPDFVDDGKGGQKLVLRGPDGNILNNPNNNLNPYTLQELIAETSLKDVIDSGRQQPGGGTQPFKPGGANHSTLDLSGAKTQVEAYRAIEQHLLASGLTRDSQEFSDQITKLGTENNVSSLPIR